MNPDASLLAPPDTSRVERRGGDAEPLPSNAKGAPLRIALVSEYYYPHLGGVTEHVHWLSRESHRTGCRSEIARRTVGGVRGGGIILLHDGDGYDSLGDRTQTAGAPPRIIAELLARGYAFETLPV